MPNSVSPFLTVYVSGRQSFSTPAGLMADGAGGAGFLTAAEGLAGVGVRSITGACWLAAQPANSKNDTQANLVKRINGFRLIRVQILRPQAWSGDIRSRCARSGTGFVRRCRRE